MLNKEAKTKSEVTCHSDEAEMTLIYELIAYHFDYNTKKAELWFKTKNPGLGNVSPKDMIRLGRTQKLKEFIENQLEGNIP